MTVLGGEWDPWDLEYQIEHGTRKNNYKQPKKKPKRTTKYAGLGHTIVTYEHRTLHYRFKQSQKDYDKAKNRRRKQAAKNRTGKERGYGKVYVNKDGSYSDSRGRDVSYRTRRTSERADRNITKRELEEDRHTLEDMRALLKDARWEEVCGHTRWKYDRQSTVREYKKYLQYHGKR
jgi:hypothetical protein